MPKESSIKIGDRFGRLEVVEKLPKDKYDTRSIKRTLFVCLCDCGNKKIIDAGNLKKITKSCGCLVKDQAREKGKRQRTERGYLNNYYGEYRRQARSHGRCFDLDFDQFVSLVTSCCYYCGDNPRIRPTKNVVGIAVPVNGIDRVDSNFGYSIPNTVPCCSVCNHMKLNFNIGEFYLKIAKILDKLLCGTQQEHVDVAKECKRVLLEFFPSLSEVLQNKQ